METQVWLMTKIYKIKGNFLMPPIRREAGSSLMSVFASPSIRNSILRVRYYPPIEAFLSLEAIMH
jgi:hypothetical protein